MEQRLWKSATLQSNGGELIVQTSAVKAAANFTALDRRRKGEYDRMPVWTRDANESWQY